MEESNASLSPTSELSAGIEILVRKAAADSEFRTMLLEDPSTAASSICLNLTPADRDILLATPKEQLAQTIDAAARMQSDSPDDRNMSEIQREVARRRRERERRGPMVSMGHRTDFGIPGRGLGRAVVGVILLGMIGAIGYVIWLVWGG